MIQLSFWKSRSKKKKKKINDKGYVMSAKRKSLSIPRTLFLLTEEVCVYVRLYDLLYNLRKKKKNPAVVYTQYVIYIYT